MNSKNDLGKISNKTALIIATRNRIGHLSRLISCLEKQILQPGQIIIISSSDPPIFSDEIESLRKSSIRIELYHVQHVNKSYSLNKGLDYLKKSRKTVLFTDDDCLPDANWVKKYSDAVEKYGSKYKLIGGVYESLQKNYLSRCYEKIIRMNTFWVKYEAESFHGGNVSIDAEIFTKFKYRFDETVFHIEDREFSLRLKSKGIKILMLKKLTLLHNFRTGIWDIMYRFFQFGFEDFLVKKKLFNFHPTIAPTKSGLFFFTIHFVGIYRNVIARYLKYCKDKDLLPGYLLIYSARLTGIISAYLYSLYIRKMLSYLRIKRRVT